MNDKKKQIEKLENIINDYLENIITVDEQTLAKKIYDKLFPKDSVVLTKEEADRFRWQTLNIKKVKGAFIN